MTETMLSHDIMTDDEVQDTGVRIKLDDFSQPENKGDILRILPVKEIEAFLGGEFKREVLSPDDILRRCPDIYNLALMRGIYHLRPNKKNAEMPLELYVSRICRRFEHYLSIYCELQNVQRPEVPHQTVLQGVSSNNARYCFQLADMGNGELFMPVFDLTHGIKKEPYSEENRANMVHDILHDVEKYARDKKYAALAIRFNSSSVGQLSLEDGFIPDNDYIQYRPVISPTDYPAIKYLQCA